MHRIDFSNSDTLTANATCFTDERIVPYSAVPPGLAQSRTAVPNVKTLGYSQKSLRDKTIAFREKRPLLDKSWWY